MMFCINYLVWHKMYIKTMGVKVEKVVICGVDTSKLPKLSYQESNQLLKKAQAGKNIS